MELDLQQFYQIFFQESEEHIQNLESCLLKLEEAPEDKELLNSIFRSAHTIKGTSGSIGLTSISEFTHLLETLLDKMRNGEVSADASLTGLILKSVDCIKGMISAVRDHSELDVNAVAGLKERLEAILNGQSVNRSIGESKQKEVVTSFVGAKGVVVKSAVIGNSPIHPLTNSPKLFDIKFDPDPMMMQKGMDPLKLIKALGVLGEILTVKLDASKLPPLKEMDPERLYLSWDIMLLTKESRAAIESVFEFVRDDSQISVTLISPASELELPPHEEHDIEVKEVREAMKELDSRSPKLVGNILMAEGTVSEEQLAGALAEQQGQKKIGEILVEQKAISEDKLKDALKKQDVIKKVDVPTIRVDVEKVDRLMNLVGELVIIQSMLSQIAQGFNLASSSLKPEALKKAVDQLERNCRDIQERVMAIRMLPIGNVFNRFPRVVRDLSAEKGKKVALLISGEETELDKTLIEKIADPLTHLIRNSVDHGIETPEDRVAKGKPDIGKIWLKAFHQGGNVIVTVEDDGKGLDREKIANKAVEKGLVGTAEGMSDQDVYNLIFLPGFSTAEKVTETSGRGVGMDVVKRNIEGIGGSVSIETEPGRRSRFVIKIPLTLAIIDGLSVSIGKETLIIPITSIVESKRPRHEEVKNVKGEGEVVNFRGHYVPLVRLHRFYGIEPKETDPTKALVVIINAENKNYALLVDDLTGQQQVVIKSLGEGFGGIPGIAGATILGSGEVAMIMDVASIVKRA